MKPRYYKMTISELRDLLNIYIDTGKGNVEVEVYGDVGWNDIVNVELCNAEYRGTVYDKEVLRID